MPLVRNYAEGESFELLPGERALQLTSSADVPLYVGIRKGEFMLARPVAEPPPTYVLTEEQYVRLEQQVRLQVTYKSWLKDGLLVITEVMPPAPPEARRDRSDNDPQPDIDNTPR